MLRVVLGQETYGREFFGYLEEPVSLVVVGDLTIEPDVPIDLFARRYAASPIGTIIAPTRLVPLVQVLTVDKLGDIKVLAETEPPWRPASDQKVPGPDGPPGFQRFYDDHDDAVFAYLLCLTGGPANRLLTFSRRPLSGPGCGCTRWPLRVLTNSAAGSEPWLATLVLTTIGRRSARPSVSWK